MNRLRSYLEARGYTPLDMRAILMQNWLRVLRSSLPV